MIKRIIKVFLLISSALSILYGGLIGIHIMFYPNDGHPVSEDWMTMLFYFGHGLWVQYVGLHVFNDRDVQKESN